MLSYKRTHNCSELRKEDIGETVILAGWVHRRRDHGGVIFIDLRDKKGLTQLIFDPDISSETHDKAQQLRSEWVISIEGKVRSRAEGMANQKLATGEIEIEIYQLNILSKSKTPPFSVCDEELLAHEELRLKYRYLDMRRGNLLDKLEKRHRAMLISREYLDKFGFSEVTTPILGKSTPEGARDYLVPSRIHEGCFYALPQSPQIFKQLLMISGLERYFQFATCFRDEDLRADRQPEFMQIDIEMSFVSKEDIIDLIEGLLKKLFKEIANVEVTTPFIRMSHKDCIEYYGTDRPDLRFGMSFVQLNPIMSKCDFTVFREAVERDEVIKGLCVPGGAAKSRREIEQYIDFVKPFGIKGLAWMKKTSEGMQSSIVKFFSAEELKKIEKAFETKEGDLLLMAAGDQSVVNQGLDHLRRHIAKSENMIPPNTYRFVWVEDFPLFTFNEKEGRIQSEHHPFTAPNPEDIEKLETDPFNIRSNSYDIVLNGYELGGGSERIFDQNLQNKIFELLKLTPAEIKEKFGFFIEALSYGTPPHAGIALGFDRLMMLLTQTENIKDVVAFPKTQKAYDLMMECPSSVTNEQLGELHIMVDTEKSLGD